MTRILIYLLLCILTAPIHAQKKVKTAPKTSQVVVEKTREQLLYESMLPSTAKILVVDSVVVNKMEFLNSIPLHKEAGTLHYVKDFFDKKGQHGSTLYQNNFGNVLYYSELTDDDNRILLSSFRMGSTWSEPKTIDGIGSEYEYPNFPFLCVDGITLYFGAKGNESIGGYDIFVTRYDSQNQRFYKPQNYGLPFNSTANDYMLVIDEIDTIGWFVSDRYQPEGKVCVYTFIPTAQRQSYDNENISSERLERLAKLYAIEDTWGSKMELGKATKKIEHYLHSEDNRNSNEEISFVIDDNTVYTHVNDFKKADNKANFMQLMEMRGDLINTEKQLDELRMEYHSSNSTQRRFIEPKIDYLEKNQKKLTRDIRNLEKQIRNSEINN